MQIRTDLAMESACINKSTLEGVRVERQETDGIEKTTVRVKSQQAAEALGKPVGTYVTLSFDEMPVGALVKREQLTFQLINALKDFLPEKSSFLIIGLGNRQITADALGSAVADQLLITRHLTPEFPALRSVCGLAPGVLGITGMETAEIVQGVIEHVHPDAVLAVDSLAAADVKHVCRTIQISDTGIQPGSGIGNRRMKLTKETLHVPVYAIGVPVVVYANTIVQNALGQIVAQYENKPEQQEVALQSMLESCSLPEHLIVTPREVDQLVENLSGILALAINQALHYNLSPKEIQELMH